jgi:ribonucleoside-diphosphate reductase beta chain
MSVFDTRSYYKPFQYPQFYEKYVQHEKAHWLPEEVPLIEDIKDWNKRLTNEEKTFLTQIFRFFTQADVDVASAYSTEYLPVFVLPEIRMMLLSFGAREAIHVQAYSHLIDTLGMPEATYQQFLEYKEMKDKHEYYEVAIGEWDDKKTVRELCKKIAIFAAFTEGMQLFSSFIMLLNFARAENGGKMKGMSQIVTWSILDETMHTLGMIDLFREIIKEQPEIWDDELKGEIYQVARDMVDLEDKFIDLAFAGYPVANLTAEEVKQYIRYVANRRLSMLGLKDNWGIETNPLRWVEEMINAPIFSNFFEQRSTDYAKASLTGSWSSVFPSN